MLQLKNIRKVYKTANENVEALKGIDIEFRKSEFVAILGQSGCGKTTLLNIIGGLDRYTTGDLIIDGRSTKDYKDRDWDAYRNYSVGFVFQSYNLISHQTILANVELALTISGYSKKQKRKKAIEALESVGLGDKIHKKPNQLSGGQMQRVAIARAIVNNPDIILADEPTGALDSKTSIQIMNILQELSKDRLIVMVTHNPELAKDYATRIVELKDGIITSDSNPVSSNEIQYKKEKMKKTKLSFTTALGLSLNNLMTKKGRTILTAFAGAIGIIGIALILSLSNGVNDYISSIESETMGSYPIELEKETIDLSSMTKNGGPGPNMEQQEEGHDNDGIYSSNDVKNSLESSKDTTVKNDLGKFKNYLDENIDSIQDSVSAIEYGYNISPVTFRKNNDNVVKVSPSYLSDYTSSKKQQNEFGGFNTSISSVWTQMVSDETLRTTQYELIAGEFPKEANEIALVISKDNEVSDYTLYTLGLMDYDKMLEMIDAIENDKEYEDSMQMFKYTDVLGLEYKVFAPCELYQKVDDVWLDKSKDEDYLIEQLENGLNVKITAVLRATDEADVSSGVVYTGKLTEYLINKTIESEIVNEQLNNPEINVLTGEKFEDDEEETDTTASVSKSSKTVATTYTSSNNKVEKTSNQYKTQTTTLGNQNSNYSVQLLSNINENINTSTNMDITNNADIVNNINTTESTNITENKILSDNMNTTENEDISDNTDNNDDTDINENKEYTIKFVNYDGTVIYEEKIKANENITSLSFEIPSKPSTNPIITNVFIGWKSSDGKYYQTSELPQVTEDEVYTALFYEYETSINETNTTMPDSGDTGNTNDFSGFNNDNINNFDSNTFNGNANNFNSNLLNGNMNNIDISTSGGFTGGDNTKLSNDQLLVLLAQMNDTTPSTYEEVLETLGYCTIDEPSSISLYPSDFEGKEAIESFIEQYNNQVENETDKVTYTDMIGTLTSSITSIVNMISYVLIAFVSISLIVSSIMIAIITYISVLERTKEIGILRALGASKKGVSKIFNAETFIEGFISGLIGIGVTLLLCIPLNSIVYSLTGVSNIASLPMKYSVVLIAISILLTVIAGVIPSKTAAKKDPAVVLRSE